MSMKDWKRMLVATLGIFSLVVSFCPALAQNKVTVRIDGGTLLAGVVDDLARDFNKANPTCACTVTGSSTGIGFKKMIEGKAEVAMMTRKVTSEEAKVAEAKGVTLSYKPIGKIGLAVVTNSKNTVSELTMDQLARIFKGEITNWSQVGGPNEHIKVTTRAVPETGSGVLFKDIVLKGAPYAKDAQIMSSFRTTLLVCGKSFAIGYMPTTTIHFDRLAEHGIKIIRIKKDANSEPYQLAQGVASESLYPISVDFYLYWNSKQDGTCTNGFAEFCAKQSQ